MNLHYVRLISTIFLAVLLTVGCHEQPLNSGYDNAPDDATKTVVHTTLGPVTILNVDPAMQIAAANHRDQHLSKSDGDSSLFYDEGDIKADKDLKLEVGDANIGKSKVEFKKNDFSHSGTLFLNWAENDVYEGEVGALDPRLEEQPFDNAVKIKMSFLRADLADVDEESISLYMFDEATQTWEALATKLKQDKRELESTINRFGKIAVLHEEDGELLPVYKLEDGLFFSRKLITAKKGGKIELGSNEIGKTKIEFKKDDLPQDMMIQFEWAAGGTLDGLLNNLEFGPHGLNFNKPVKVEISYQMADMTDIDEDDLVFIYYNDILDEWELIPSTIDTKKKKVKVYLEHFSRYALAHGRR